MYWDISGSTLPGSLQLMSWRSVVTFSAIIFSESFTPAAYRQSHTPEPMSEPFRLVERDFKNIRHNVVVKHIVKDLPELHLLGRF
jgi:hypothetical protein